MMISCKRVASAEAVRELVDSAFATRYHDLATMLNLSSKAVALAEEKYEELPADLVVAAWIQYGNALRIAGRYGEAEKALARAAALPATDEPTKIHLLEVTASLHLNTGRFESASRLLTSVISLVKLTGDSQGEVRAYNLLGLVFLHSGDREEALRAFKTALDLIGPDSPPDLLVATGHNLFETLIAVGNLSTASAVLVLLEPYYQRLTSVRLSAKAEWMRARLCRALNQPAVARLAYERAYALLITEPRSPELTDLAKEMADLLPQG